MDEVGQTSEDKNGRNIVQSYVGQLSELLRSQIASVRSAELRLAALRADIKETGILLKKAQADLERLGGGAQVDVRDGERDHTIHVLEMTDEELASVLRNDELSTSEKIRRVSRYVLERSQPLKRRSLLKAVTEAGLSINAADPADTLRKAIERDAGFSKDANGYWLNH